MRVQCFNSVGEERSSAYVQRAERYVFDTEGPSLTRTEFAEECDVNALMARYEKTGEMIPGRVQREPRYLDLSDVPDLHQAMSVLHAAEAAFNDLPAMVRRQFENDVQEFVRFAEDPANLDQLRQWGLAKPAEPDPEPLKVQVVGESSVAPQGAVPASAGPAKSS